MKSPEWDSVSTMRVAEWLKSKQLISISEQSEEYFQLAPEGKNTAREGFPERVIIELLLTDKPQSSKSISDLRRSSQLTPQAFNAALGWLVRKKWVTVKKDALNPLVRNSPPIGSDEELLKKLAAEGVTKKTDIPQNLIQGLNQLLQRKTLIKRQKRTQRTLKLTEKGLQILKEGIEEVEEVSQLTVDLIRSGSWKKTKFRSFDISAPVNPSPIGKLHPFNVLISDIRRIFLEMGFTEIRGPLVDSAFWNFDALFQPQDHPAREMQDTFYVKNPASMPLPKRQYVHNVSKTHQNGWTTGSKGWGYKWTKDLAKQNVLRPHTTCNTIKYLAENPTPPVKVFSVDRVFRNEKMTFKHTAEFYQYEGIIMDRNVTMRDLIGTLTNFYHKLGFKKVQFWPSFFPYTSPSAQSSVYMPKLKKWVELGGMGIFRPEVTQPFGIKHPVLAWGCGVERLLMLKLGVDDIRQIYKNDLTWLRSEPLCQLSP
jgi:phenylalanyl-tRNA synthetase alpha chain